MFLAGFGATDFKGDWMATAAELTDVFGARLRGSPAYAAAADWARQQLASWGLSNVAFEPGGYTDIHA